MNVKRINQEVIVASIISIIVLCVIFIGVITEKTVASASTTKDEKYVMSIRIEKGDTLWGIAKENITSHYESIDEYIEEIMECNSLTSDTIHEGQFLIIPYYSTPIN
ncbi:LysM repeat-containing protein [Anaerosporobacter mobilis DSM 15930]|jgi:LysM repeat protein|uniref:LysM repeat-containing protein n=1 Tax=Anaerosporobacter mobilis DSM 15930 TaxID=1120996 RepID=A0A1M7EKS7_9FIRM|nr:LysM peptidoglycan-binding domain-containing protein [Anaerosporobacter mobilis]SHL92216.1 LysM repeat-containing protein [Anaerosporobacter mobilis DSM 15930]